MIRFVWEKLIHKKWLNMSTLLGIILLIGVAAGSNLYRGAALDRLLQSGFDVSIGEQNVYPAVVEAQYLMAYTGEASVTICAEEICSAVDAQIESLLPMQTAEVVRFLASDSLLGVPEYKSDTSTQDLFFMPGNLSGMEEHVEILKGSMYRQNADEQGIYECIINESMVYGYNLSVGEVISFPKTEMKDGKELKIRIAGIFKENDSHDAYWYHYPNSYEKILFISETALNEMMTNRAAESMNTTLVYDVLLDYEAMNYKQAQAVKAGITQLTGNPPVVKMTVTSGLADIMEEYLEAESQVEATMQTLQIPLMVLLLAFLYMVSSNVFEMEKNEIAMLKSRGVSNRQVMGIYFFQSFLLTAVGLVPGILLGWAMAALLGSADAFMEFVGKSRMRIVPDEGLLVTVLVVGLVAVLFMTMPVLRYTALSVVEIRHKKGNLGKVFWLKYYLDVVVLAVALYIRYSLLKQQEVLEQQILRGEGTDPVLFLSSVLFILGCGMVFLRILQVAIRAIYRLGRKRWKPASYVSFLQIIRSGGKQNFISLFLILTIAMGIFYANTARSMNTGIEERIRYDVGAGIVSSELWQNNLAYAKKNSKTMTYTEPNYLRYEELLSDADGEKEQIEGMTRVIRDENTRMYYGDKMFEGNQLMAIHTKEFGEVAWMKDGVLNQHWYHYLNAIAQVPNGVLVSANFRDKMGAQEGDVIKYAIFDELGNARALTTATICGFVEAWPGYAPYKEERTADGSISYRDSYLIVANYSMVVNSFGATPYEIWYKTDAGAQVITDFAEEKGIELTGVVSAEDELKRNKQDAKVQVTNGLLTISFLVILILCAAGFLIYWVLAVKKRELMFGIYRAMGMGMKEVRYMLVHEQLFASATAIAVGAGVGFLASYLYIPLLMIVYLPGKHALHYGVVSAMPDMVRIGIVVAMMLALCFVVLAKVVSGMKIAQALKLGED